MHQSIALMINDVTRIGGTEVFTIRLAHELLKLGHKIQIITGYSNSEVRFSPSNLEFSRYSSTNQFLEVLQGLNEQKYVLLFTDIPFDIHTNEEFRQLFYKTLDGINSPKYLRLRSQRSIEELLSFHGKNRLYSHFDGFITQSPSTLDMSSAVFGGKCLEIPNGVPLDKFRLINDSGKIIARDRYGIPANARVYLYVGRYLPKKGFDEIQLGWREWKKSRDHNDSYLLTVGYNPEQPKQNYSDRQSGIIDLGVQPEVEVIRALHSSDFFLFPSRGEGLSNALIEAFACGVIPLIYKDLSGTECIDGSIGVFIPDTNNGFQNVASTLEETYKMDESVRRSFSQKGRNLAEQKFNILSVGLEYSTLLDSHKPVTEERGFRGAESFGTRIYRSRK